MVDYAEEADFIRPAKRRTYRTPQEIAQQRKQRNAQRTPADWKRFASEIVYRQLSMTDRSEYQLLQALQRRDVPKEIALSTIQKFVQSGLVDDLRFAKMYVRSVFHAKSISVRMMRFELKKRGIADEIAEQALVQIDPAAEESSAIEYAQRKIKSMLGLERQVIFRRLSGQLARRGFSSGVVRAALEAAFNSLDE